MKNLNRAGGALSESSRYCHQLVQTHFALHLNARRLAHSAKHSGRLPAVAFRDTNAHLRVVDELRVRGGDVFLYFLVRAAFRDDWLLDKRQRAEVAVAVDLYATRQLRLTEDTNVEHVTWSKQVRLDPLHVHW